MRTNIFYSRFRKLTFYENSPHIYGAAWRRISVMRTVEKGVSSLHNAENYIKIDIQMPTLSVVDGARQA